MYSKCHWAVTKLFPFELMLEDTSSSVTTAEARSLKIELRMGLNMSVASCCVDMLSCVTCDGNNLQNDIRAVLLMCSKTLFGSVVPLYLLCQCISKTCGDFVQLFILFRIVCRMMAGKVMVTNKTPAWCFKQLLWAIHLFILLKLCK